MLFYRKAGLLKSPLYFFYKTTPKLGLLVGQNSVDSQLMLPPSRGLIILLLSGLPPWGPEDKSQ